MIKSRERRTASVGKKKKKPDETEKELLDRKRIKFQIYESLASIVLTIVTMILAIVTAVLNWIE
ncbi:MAG: hypothetical protein KHY93_01845 [Clostridiales bacterium]|nr:hypothetical protein [Clostridiales bacterium]